MFLFFNARDAVYGRVETGRLLLDSGTVEALNGGVHYDVEIRRASYWNYIKGVAVGVSGCTIGLTG